MTEIQDILAQYADMKQRLDHAEHQRAVLEVLAKKNGVSVDTIARLVFAGDNVRLRNYSDRKLAAGFGADTNKVTVEFDLQTNGPFFPKCLTFSQYRDTTAPTNTYLPNAGFRNNGNGTLIQGLSFEFKLRSSDSMDLDSDWRSSAELEGPLCSILNLPCEQEFEVNRSLYVDVKPLAAAGGDTYTLHVGISGVMVIAGEPINKAWKKHLRGQ